MTNCYMCNRPATSREHVPPRSLFPEQKDSGGEDYRKNLITVPSCREHNSRKSADDEFLMVSLAGIIGNNSIGLRHKFSKVNRSIKRSANRLLWEVFNDQKVYVVNLDKNQFLDLIWGKPDQLRLHRCFDRIGRGVFLHHFGERFRGEIKTMLGYLRYEDAKARNFSDFVRDKVAMEMVSKEELGENPKVFFYQVSDIDQLGLFTIRLCFYGGVDVYCAFLPEGSEVPRNFAFEFAKMGVKTVLTLGDKEYEIG